MQNADYSRNVGEVRNLILASYHDATAIETLAYRRTERYGEFTIRVATSDRGIRVVRIRQNSEFGAWFAGASRTTEPVE